MTGVNLTSEEYACPLCKNSTGFTPIIGPKERGYLLCPSCQLIFMKPEFLPDSTSEKKRYQAHQNGPQDAGYVQFLNQAITPALPYLNPNMRGLDFGCGPTPTLSGLLLKHGFQCENYDPYFLPALPEIQYDFIFSTEVVEHFYNPDKDLQFLSSLLKPGGIFTIMTEPWLSLVNFAEWHYAKDITHVSFYHADTITFISQQYGFEILNNESPRVTVLRKNQL